MKGFPLSAFEISSWRPYILGIHATRFNFKGSKDKEEYID
jgi:hypothetical protein